MIEALEGRFLDEKEPPIIYLLLEHPELPIPSFSGCLVKQVPDSNISQKEIISFLLTHPADAIYTDRENQNLFRTLHNMGFSVYTKVKPEGLPYGCIEHKGITIYTFGGKKRNRRWEKMKRFFDICGSIMGLFLTAIVYLRYGKKIKEESGGSIIYRQERVGFDGRRFTMYKFRTMISDADQMRKELLSQNEMHCQMFKMEHDPRVTKIGEFLRRSSLDELPQFYNVLRGDMSIVGTRPPLLDEMKNYKPHHRKRLLSKPGITGMWQTSGRNAVSDFEETMKLDLFWIKNENLFLYFEIIAKTCLCVLKKDGK